MSLFKSLVRAYHEGRDVKDFEASAGAQRSEEMARGIYSEVETLPHERRALEIRDFPRGRVQRIFFRIGYSLESMKL